MTPYPNPLSWGILVLVQKNYKIRVNWNLQVREALLNLCLVIFESTVTFLQAVFPQVTSLPMLSMAEKRKSPPGKRT